ncbi:MAG: fasciclin domain-containing protein [Myxococcales bacterium]|nr:fasciclin domain-containing protein [Myxococcales bacterium]
MPNKSLRVQNAPPSPRPMRLLRGTRSLLSVAVSFRSFLALAVRAGLLQELDGDEVFLVLAPTEAAFANLPRKLSHGLFMGPLELAFEIAEHHLIRGGSLDPGLQATLQGESLLVRSPRVGVARIAGLPRVCRNGLLVPVDQVLVPRWGSKASDTVRLRRFLAEGELAATG